MTIATLLADNPLLTCLGRRGRGAVADRLLADPDRSWTVRDLARAAAVHPMVASRAVQELQALGAVEAFRPGRAMMVRLLPAAAVTGVLRGLAVPDLRAEAVRAFAAAFPRWRGVRLLAWREPGDRRDDPLAPPRVAVVSDDVDRATEAVGPALDATAAAGWPRPDVTVLARSMLADDPVSRAVLAGQVL